MKDITILPTQRISEDEHKLALRLLRELQDTGETGEVAIQWEKATEKTQAVPTDCNEPGRPAQTSKVGEPAFQQAPSRPAIAGSPATKRRKFRLFPFSFTGRRKLPTRQLPPPPAAELSPARAQEPSYQAKPSRPYLLIPIPVRTSVPNAQAILRLYPRNYKHVYLLIDGKRNIAEIAFMKRELGGEGIAYVVEQFEKAGIVKVTHRVELRAGK